MWLHRSRALTELILRRQCTGLLEVTMWAFVFGCCVMRFSVVMCVSVVWVARWSMLRLM